MVGRGRQNQDALVAYTSVDNARKFRTKSEGRYINKKMEDELIAYKREIERRFGNSTINQYSFPKKKVAERNPNPFESPKSPSIFKSLVIQEYGGNVGSPSATILGGGNSTKANQAYKSQIGKVPMTARSTNAPTQKLARNFSTKTMGYSSRHMRKRDKENANPSNKKPKKDIRSPQIIHETEPDDVEIVLVTEEDFTGITSKKEIKTFDHVRTKSTASQLNQMFRRNLVSDGLIKSHIGVGVQSTKNRNNANCYSKSGIGGDGPSLSSSTQSHVSSQIFKTMTNLKAASKPQKKPGHTSSSNSNQQPKGQHKITKSICKLQNSLKQSEQTHNNTRNGLSNMHVRAKTTSDFDQLSSTGKLKMLKQALTASGLANSQLHTKVPHDYKNKKKETRERSQKKTQILSTYLQQPTRCETQGETYSDLEQTKTYDHMFKSFQSQADHGSQERKSQKPLVSARQKQLKKQASKKDMFKGVKCFKIDLTGKMSYRSGSSRERK